MKILLVSHFAPGLFEYGGLATYTRELARALRDMGHNVHLLAIAPVTRAQYTWEDIPVTVIPGSLDDKADLAAGEILSYCMNASDYDVIIRNDYFTFPCFNRTSKIISLFHITSGSPWETLAFPYSDKIVANSRLLLSLFHDYARQIIDLYHGWTGKNPVLQVVYPAPPTPPNEIPEVKLDMEPPVLCYLGRMQEPKNFSLFMEVVNELGASAIVVSHDVVSADYGWLKVYGNVDEATKYALIRNCTLGVIPSKFEPFGLVAYEFLLAGVPVVMSRNMGAAEVIWGYTFNPDDKADAIEKVKTALEDIEEYREKQFENSKWALERTWRHVAEEILG